MNKSKLYIIIIIGLLLSNILLIAFFIGKKPPHPMHGGPRNEIIAKLNFDENQIKQYDELIKLHRKEIEKKEGEIIELKNTLYLQLAKEENKAPKDSIINELGRIQIEIENTHYSHFADIKAICKPEQLESYNQLLKEIAKLFSHQPPPKDKPKE